MTRRKRVVVARAVVAAVAVANNDWQQQAAAAQVTRVPLAKRVREVSSTRALPRVAARGEAEGVVANTRNSKHQ